MNKVITQFHSLFYCRFC